MHLLQCTNPGTAEYHISTLGKRHVKAEPAFPCQGVGAPRAACVLNEISLEKVTDEAFDSLQTIKNEMSETYGVIFIVCLRSKVCHNISEPSRMEEDQQTYLALVRLCSPF